MARMTPVRRVTQLLVGLLASALPMALLLPGGQGGMPWDALHQGVVRRTVVVITRASDPALALVERAVPDPGVAASVALALGGIVLNGVATAAYLGVRLGPGPRDGLMTGLVARTGWSVRLVRTLIEVVV